MTAHSHAMVPCEMHNIVTAVQAFTLVAWSCKRSTHGITKFARVIACAAQVPIYTAILDHLSSQPR